MKKITFNDISFSYNKLKPIFKNLSFHLKSENNNGYIYGLMGPSGCGKTTLIKLILNLENVSSGDISIYPHNPIISYIPQNAVLFEHMSAEENAKFFSYLSNYQEVYDRNIFEHVKQVLALDNILNNRSKIAELSGGELQRLALLRALSIRPDILLFDEPLIGLDSAVKNDILLLIRKLIYELNILAIYVTHNFQESALIADDMIYLHPQESNIIESTFIDNTSNFSNFPPTLESAISVYFPYHNVIRCTIENNIIVLNNQSELIDKNDKFIILDYDSIQYSFDGNYKIIDIIKTSQYNLTTIENQALPLKVKMNHNQLAKYVELNGTGLLYNNKKLFESKIKIKNNAIIK